MWKRIHEVIRRCRSSVILLVLAALVLAPESSRALGDLEFPWTATLHRANRWGITGWSVETAEAQRLDATGLRLSGARGEWIGRRWGVGMAAVRVGAPVGSETRWTARVGVSNGGLWVWGQVDLHELSIGEHTSTLGTVGAHALIPVSERVAIDASVSGVRISGFENPGADTSLRVMLGAGAGFELEAGVTVHRRYGASLVVLSRARLADRFTLSAGYDGGVESVHTGVGIRVAAVRVHAGVTMHAVLGVSRVVGLRWQR